jgi:hypothetical protein
MHLTLTENSHGGYVTQVINVTGRPQTKPDLIDLAQDPVIYEGYKVRDTYFICKVDATTSVISRKWATGSWDSRLTLNYL